MHLLERVAAGDPAAVQDCIAQYGALVWSLARRLSPSEADAEDAVQEIFLSIWQNAGRFDARLAAESTFVAMLARRRLIDRSRKAKRQVDAEMLSDAVASPVDARRDPIELADEAARIRRILEQLRPEQRQVLEMSIERGFSHEQISAATGWPLGTVKSHARRGLIKARELLGAAKPDGSKSGGANVAREEASS